VCISWRNKKGLGTTDARCKHEDKHEESCLSFVSATNYLTFRALISTKV